MFILFGLCGDGKLTAFLPGFFISVTIHAGSSSPHCLKKKGTLDSWHWSRMERIQSGWVGRALWPLSPPAITQLRSGLYLCPLMYGASGWTPFVSFLDISPCRGKNSLHFPIRDIKAEKNSIFFQTGYSLGEFSTSLTSPAITDTVTV